MQQKNRSIGLRVTTIVFFALCIVMEVGIVLTGAIFSFQTVGKSIVTALLMITTMVAFIVYAVLCKNRAGRWCMLIALIFLLVQCFFMTISAIQGIVKSTADLYSTYEWNATTITALSSVISGYSMAICYSLTALMMAVGIILVSTNHQVRGVLITVAVIGMLAASVSLFAQCLWIGMMTDYTRADEAVIVSGMIMLLVNGLFGLFNHVGLILAGCAYTRFDKEGNIIGKKTAYASAPPQPQPYDDNVFYSNKTNRF